MSGVPTLSSCWTGMWLPTLTQSPPPAEPYEAMPEERWRPGLGRVDLVERGEGERVLSGGPGQAGSLEGETERGLLPVGGASERAESAFAALTPLGCTNWLPDDFLHGEAAATCSDLLDNTPFIPFPD